jgi:hypothetical protein
MGMSDLGSDMFLDAMLEVSPLPASLYLAVTEQAPDVDDDGTTIAEPGDSSYVRQPLGLGSANWASSQGGISFYTPVIAFPVATEDWKAARCWVICDSLADGSVVLWGNFESPYELTIGQQVLITTGSFGISVAPESEDVIV